MADESIRPHTAIINCQLEIHSLLDTGECSGRIVDAETLKEYDIKPNFILAVNGFDRNDCLTKLKEKISQFLKEENK